MKSLSFCLLIISLISCIGTDVIEEDFAINSRLNINQRILRLVVGDSAFLSIDFVNKEGLSNLNDINYKSTDTSKVTVDSAGLVIAEKVGRAYISAFTAELSDSLEVVVFADSADLDSTDVDSTLLFPTRSGMFQPLNNYTAGGSIILKDNQDGSLTLSLGTDFTVSNGPGVYLYLSNSTSSVSGGYEIAKMSNPSGAQDFTLSGTTLNAYDKVVLWCKPFSLPFGFSDLN